MALYIGYKCIGNSGVRFAKLPYVEGSGRTIVWQTLPNDTTDEITCSRCGRTHTYK
jgi:hypothetical protein